MRNAKYPNKFSTKEKYITSLIGNYSLEYQTLDLSREQWELPITKVVNCVSGSINDFDGHQWSLKAIDYVKDAILPDLSREEIGLITSSYNDRTELYYLSIGKEEEVRCLLEEQFPESQKKQYLEFISRMTKDVVNAICLETLKSIPETEKVIYQRRLAQEVRSSNSSNVDESQKEQSFAQRALNESSKNLTSETKKRKVSFVDEIIKKNRGNNKPSALK